MKDLTDRQLLELLVNKFVNLESNVAELKHDVAELKHDVAELKHDVAELKQNQIKTEVSVMDLKKELVEKVVGLKIEIMYMDEVVTRTEENLTKQEALFRAFRQSQQSATSDSQIRQEYLEREVIGLKAKLEKAS